MFIIFCLAQIVAGLFMLVFGAALIESPDNITMILGCMFALVGIIVMVVYSFLLDKQLKGDMF